MQIKAVTPNTFAAIADYESSADSAARCTNLREDLIKFEGSCYDFTYHLYVSLVLIAIMMVFCFFFIISLWRAFGPKDNDDE